MKKAYLELVGLLASTSKAAKTYRIDYLYRLISNDVLVGDTLQKGFDWPIHIPFKEVVTSLTDAYAPALQKVWCQEDRINKRVFMSLRRDISPSNSNLKGQWKLHIQR